jgi:predicted transcriptional regulator of viral defense system
MTKKEYTILLDGVPIPSISTVSKILNLSRVALQVRLKRKKYYLKELHNGKVLIIKLFTYNDDNIRNTTREN